MLMKANKAKCALTRVLDVDDALKVSRKMWGHADSVKEHKDEARRAARVLETAVGEALGPVTRDHDRRPGAKLPASNIAPHDASRFRLMAAHRDLWWPVLAEKALSRRQVLTMIAEATVYENGTLRDAKWVANAYELSARIDNLPITRNEPSPRRRGLVVKRRSIQARVELKTI